MSSLDPNNNKILLTPVKKSQPPGTRRIIKPLEAPKAIAPMAPDYQAINIRGIYRCMQHSIVCHFCKENGEAYEDYHSHRLRNPRTGRLECPVLRSHICELCGASGERAHTRSYCPQKAKLPVEEKVRCYNATVLKKTTFTAAGRRFVETKKKKNEGGKSKLGSDSCGENKEDDQSSETSTATAVEEKNVSVIDWQKAMQAFNDA